MSSHSPSCERVFRVHQSTLEWMPVFLPSIWLCAYYSSDVGAAVLGLVWMGARYLIWGG